MKTVKLICAEGHVTTRDYDDVQRPCLHCGVERNVPVALMILPDMYQQQALRTEKTPQFVGALDLARNRTLSRLMHGMIGICTEAGELQDMVKKHLIYGKDFDPTNVIEECGDLLWYIALTLDAAGYKLSDCMARNIAKLKARYPEGFTKEKALARDLSAELDALQGDSMLGRCMHGIDHGATHYNCGCCVNRGCRP